MTPRGKIGSLLTLLAVLALVLVRLWMVSVTSATAFEDRFNAQLPEGAPGLNQFGIGHTRLGLTGGSRIAENVRLFPDSATLVRLDSAGTPVRTRYDLDIPRIELRGIDRMAWLRGQLVAREAVVHGPEFDVRFDRRIPDPSPGPAVPPPHATLRQVASDLTVDRFVSRGGRIR